MKPSVFDSMSAFLGAPQRVASRCFDQRSDRPACLVVSVENFGPSELELHQTLVNHDAPPVVFVTLTADLSSCVRAIRTGAVDILQRPFEGQCLIRSIESAFAIDRETWLRKSEIARFRRHYDRLTPRERQVLPLVTQGLLNKQTAAELGTSEITVCVHRGQIMRKMAARSLPDLVRMVDKLGVQQPRSLEYLPGQSVIHM